MAAPTSGTHPTAAGASNMEAFLPTLAQASPSHFHPVVSGALTGSKTLITQRKMPLPLEISTLS